MIDDISASARHIAVYMRPMSRVARSMPPHPAWPMPKFQPA